MGVQVCGYGSQVTTYGSSGVWIWEQSSLVARQVGHRGGYCTTTGLTAYRSRPPMPCRTRSGDHLWDRLQVTIYGKALLDEANGLPVECLELQVTIYGKASLDEANGLPVE